MKKPERQRTILTMLRQNPDLTVTNLSAQLGVSQVTLRKDLTQMEAEGILVRAHGKAVLSETISSVSTSCFIPPEAYNDHKAKQIIGTLAAQFVQDEDFIFLGPGYTCLEVAKNLRTKERLSILTTNISAAIELSDISEFTLRISPGNFTKRNGTYYVTGPAVWKYCENTYFDKIFITVDGVSPERGFSVLDETTAQIFQKLFKPDSRVYVCATSSKFTKNALAPLGPLTLASKIITDTPIYGPCANVFQEHGIDIITPQNSAL